MLPWSPAEAPSGLRIDLLRLMLDPQARVKSPFRIELRFIAQPDAAIDPASFRALYGNLQLDITSSILDNVKLAAGGFSSLAAAIPPGRHRLLLLIGDLRQGTGELDLRFDVEQPPFAAAARYIAAARNRPHQLEDP